MHLFWALVLVLGSFFPSLAQGKTVSAAPRTESFTHAIQLQLADGNGIPVPGTQFWITLNIIKEGRKVTLQLPNINFQTGPYANYSFESPPFLPGGYLVTNAGFLPKHVRPSDIVYRSWLAPSNNGASLPFSLAQSPSTLPIPPAGYILSITNTGALVIQGAGSPGNIIPPGPQILLPTDISYFIDPRTRLKRNTLLSTTGSTSTAQFTNPAAANDGLRDTHVNDAFDGRAAWAWSDNSTVVDKTSGTLNLMVAVGKLVQQGKLKVSKPIQLTDLAPGIMVWDTAVAINRTNKSNIVVSYGVTDRTSATTKYTMSRAVSFDGGKTWPEKGPTNVQPTGLGNNFGDNRGVASDTYGNIWYASTNRYDDLGHLVNQPFFAVSTDGGVSFELIYTAPYPSTDTHYDFPQYCFGGDGSGVYGLNFVADIINTATGDIVPAVGFIPITGLGQFGTPDFAQLPNLMNVNPLASITASLDGRIWTFGSATPIGSVVANAFGMVFKSPGPIDQNYAGPWNFATINALNEFFSPVPPPFDYQSQPFFGYIPNAPQSNLYDDKRQALYGIVVGRSPDFSQNMRLYFAISRDNGQTWSKAIDISNTDFANRGFQSMALDTSTGDLYFGWYDGRNDPAFQSVEYFGGVIPSKQLDKLVKNIPLSNPLYTIP